jgi:hypothetical protein
MTTKELEQKELRMTIAKTAAAALMAGMSIVIADPAWAAMPTANITSIDPGPQLLDQLASAKQQDWQYSLDPSVAPARKDDFLDQMNKADRAIALITHGFKVPDQELANALWIPPKVITLDEREKLIQDLQSAKLVDDHNEQAMFKYSEWSMSDGGGAPIDTVTFDDQMQLVDSIIKDLEIGEVVPWSTIREALSVPPAAD